MRMTIASDSEAPTSQPRANSIDRTLMITTETHIRHINDWYIFRVATNKTPKPKKLEQIHKSSLK